MNRSVVIVGAGVAGICAGVRLTEAGFDVTIFEKSSRVGGVWNYNSYPGAACDIASVLYSFSFNVNPRWTRPFARQDEIQAYLADTVRDFDLERRIRCNTGVRSLVWSESDQLWTIELDSGESCEARYVISAVGLFGEPATPDIPGLETFTGKHFHSARWDHEQSLEGRSVAVIGSAASAVQLIPEVAKVVGHLDVYQRSANWVLPKDDEPYSPDTIQEFISDPSTLLARRSDLFDIIDLALDYSRNEAMRNAAEQRGREALEQVTDAETRRKLTPSHAWGCKRPLMSADFYPVFNQPNVELITEPIAQIDGDCIVTSDGRRRRVDTIIFATGFHVGRYLAGMDVVGRDGRRIDDVWQGVPTAYLGIMTAGFPNLFMLYGPNTNGGNSIMAMIESQMSYVMDVLDVIERSDVAWVDVREEVLAEYDARVQRDLDSIEVWGPGGCNGYYRGPSGRIITQWPHGFGAYTRLLENPDLSSFETSR